jgi:hypothetical protein
MRIRNHPHETAGAINPQYPKDVAEALADGIG